MPKNTPYGNMPKATHVGGTSESVVYSNADKPAHLPSLQTKIWPTGNHPFPPKKGK